jgi:hypothetical protein
MSFGGERLWSCQWCTDGHPGARNDKSIVRFDKYVMEIKDGNILGDYKFSLLDGTGAARVLLGGYARKGKRGKVYRSYRRGHAAGALAVTPDGCAARCGVPTAAIISEPGGGASTLAATRPDTKKTARRGGSKVIEREVGGVLWVGGAGYRLHSG